MTYYLQSRYCSKAWQLSSSSSSTLILFDVITHQEEYTSPPPSLTQRHQEQGGGVWRQIEIKTYYNTSIRKKFSSVSPRALDALRVIDEHLNMVAKGN